MRRQPGSVDWQAVAEEIVHEQKRSRGMSEA